MLTDGFHPIPPGRVAAIVTHLRMDRPAAPPPAPDLPLRHVADPDPAWYRDLFTRVGALDWLWFSRLRMPEAELRAILRDPDVEVRVFEADGRAEGLVELDFRTPGTCELAFFGLAPALQGRGLGRAMMGAALHHGFARDIPEMTVHTCTFDSPVALPFYIREGFVPVRREVEVVPDPRLDGTLPEGAAAHVPRIG
ncbi:GNAT family N-acetyltransferase [Jannaschia formosa]|uniref:GNAT family N-acetyltransferase n=1 Tax=Jannaschia formosa TaxID=2259592 RepID=UPI000E1BF0E0|nr:GNAT family N-acetyltransferase [Jannaschia formosa]TFL18740.1 GNAT family N-acetyltransferase [Jannaschia formosa]